MDIHLHDIIYPYMYITKYSNVICCVYTYVYPYDHLFVQALTHRKYSTKSDVWSFGVVLFEIWAIGKKPYGGTSNPDVSPLMHVLIIVELSQAVDSLVREHSVYIGSFRF